MLTLTFGRGLTNPVGLKVPLRRVDLLDACARVLEQHRAPSAWWSASVFAGNRRRKSAWRSAAGVVLDLDFHDSNGDRAALSAVWKIRLFEALCGGALMGNLFHLTPRGLRVVVLYSRQVKRLELHRACSRAVIFSLERSLRSAGLSRRRGADGLTIDRGASSDIAHMFWSPNTQVGRVQRAAPMLAGAPLLSVPEVLAKRAPPDPRRIKVLVLNHPAPKLLQTACARIAAAPTGARNNTLNAQVYYLAANGASREAIEGEVLQAAKVAGLTMREASRTFDSAFQAGVSERG